MREALRGLTILAVAAASVHTLYVQFIRPRAEILIEAGVAAGQYAPRDWVVILKDWEQEICLILAIYCVVEILIRLYKLSKEQYLFEVDFVGQVESGETDLKSTLEDLESLPRSVGQSQLVETLKASIRRYRITSDVQNTSDAIQTSVDAVSMRLEADNTMLRYLIWAIPSIGFIGTVRGIGQALSQADQALSGDISEMTASLGIAFNSTFVALVISIFLMLLLHSLQRAQDRRLVDIQSYCEEFLLNRISQ